MASNKFFGSSGFLFGSSLVGAKGFLESRGAFLTVASYYFLQISVSFGKGMVAPERILDRIFRTPDSFYVWSNFQIRIYFRKLLRNRKLRVRVWYHLKLFLNLFNLIRFSFAEFNNHKNPGIHPKD